MTIAYDRTAWIKGCGAHCLSSPKATGNPVRLVLLGAPGVGKGTLAAALNQRLQFCHLSTGELFRAARHMPQDQISPALREALEYMNQGQLVPDATVIHIMNERIRCLHCAHGFMLDGYPRTAAQADALTGLFKNLSCQLDLVLSLQIPIEKVVQRLGGRRACARCKAVYNLFYLPPKVEDVCDQCGGSLIQREDDKPEAVRVRMEVYQKSTTPLIDYYQEQGLLETVSAEGEPEEVYAQTVQILKSRGWPRRASRTSLVELSTGPRKSSRMAGRTV